MTTTEKSLNHQRPLRAKLHHYKYILLHYAVNLPFIHSIPTNKSPATFLAK